MSYFHVFGCRAYIHIHKDHRKKLDAKAIEVVYLGYEPDSKEYRLWDKCTHSVKVSRDVTFDKSSFPSCIEIEGNSSTSTTLPPIPTPFYPVTAEPNQPALPPHTTIT